MTQLQATTTYQDIFGQIIKAARIDGGVSQNELAPLVEMSQPALSKIERGAADVTLSQILELSRVLRLNGILDEIKNTAEIIEARGVKVVSRDDSSISRISSDALAALMRRLT